MSRSILIEVDALRVGMFIQLEQGWMNHPFPKSNFKLSSLEQIGVLRAMGLKSVRYVPAQSTHEIEEPLASAPEVVANAGSGAQDDANHKVTDLLQWFNARQEHCNQRFRFATNVYATTAARARHEPLWAREQVEALLDACVADLLAQGPCAVHLLVGGAGQASAMHAVNVMVLALTLGQSLGLQAPQLRGLGMSALLHDIGKVGLPGHVAEPGGALAAADLQRYQSHVGLSVELAQHMGLSSDVLIAIAQHHEMADGSGYPLHLIAEDIGPWGQIVALVNRYDRLCHPLHGEPVLTPHEALARLFAQLRENFDSVVLGAFVRLMGVYPAGSLVQLTDGRYAVVALVDPAQALRPYIVLYQPHVPRNEAVVLNLASTPELGILRSLRSTQLPRMVLEYLLPQARVSYFFEPVLGAFDQGDLR